MPYIEEALLLAGRVNNPSSDGLLLIERAVVLQANQRFGEAVVSYQEAVALHRRLGDHCHEAQALAGVATLYRECGNPHAAVAFHERAIAIQREIGDRRNLAHSLDQFAATLDHLGDIDSSRRCRRDALELFALFDEPAAKHARDRIAECLTRTVGLSEAYTPTRGQSPTS